MSNCSQDTDYSKISVPGVLTTVMKIAGFGGRSFVKLVNAKDAEKYYLCLLSASKALPSRSLV